MKDLNNIALLARLTKDAELSALNNSSKLDFSIAWNTTKKNDNEYVDEVSYANLTMWGKVADAIAPRMKKGVQVAISGHLKQNRWESNGEKKSALNIMVDEIQILGGKKADAETSNQAMPSNDIPNQMDIPF